MNLRHVKNWLPLAQGRYYPLVVIAFVAGIVLALCYSEWWTALILSVLMLGFAIVSFRVFLVMASRATAFAATDQGRFPDAEAHLRRALAHAEKSALGEPWRSMLLQD